MSGSFPSHGPGYKNHEHQFPLELVASIAARVLIAHKDFERQPPYKDAVDVAIRLLQACQSRLEDDRSIHVKDQPLVDSGNRLRESFQERTRLEQKHGNPVPFLKGLLYITRQKCQKDALPHYMRWLLHCIETAYAEAESRQFFGQPKPPPQPTPANLELELGRQRREGFHPLDLVFRREDYAKWHVEINLPARKRRPK